MIRQDEDVTLGSSRDMSGQSLDRPGSMTIQHAGSEQLRPASRVRFQGLGQALVVILRLVEPGGDRVGVQSPGASLVLFSGPAWLE